MPSFSSTVRGETGGLDPALAPKCWNNYWNTRESCECKPLDHRPIPQSVLQPNDAPAVVAALEGAKQLGLAVTARSTGHHCAALSIKEGALQLDLSSLTGVRIDAKARRAWVQPGLTSGALYAALAPYRLHCPAGHVSGVGTCGFCLHGGVGWNARALGFGCDNVLSFKVAVPNGGSADKSGRAALVEASPAVNPDLYWACRGGGMFVGVVVEMELAVYPSVAFIPVVMVDCEVGDAHAVWRLWRTAIAHAPPTVHAMAVIHVVNEKPVMSVGFWDFGVTAEEQAAGQAVVKACVAGLVAEAGGSVAMDASLPYEQALTGMNKTGDFPEQCVYNASAFTPWDDVNTDFLDILTKHFATVSSSRTAIVLAPTAPSPSPSPGAFGNRANCLWYEVLTGWERTDAGPVGDGDAAHVAWADGIFGELQAAGWMPLNYLNNSMLLGKKKGTTGGVTKQECYHADEWRKLGEVKAKWDPCGLLASLT